MRLSHSLPSRLWCVCLCSCLHINIAFISKLAPYQVERQHIIVKKALRLTSVCFGVCRFTGCPLTESGSSFLQAIGLQVRSVNYRGCLLSNVTRCYAVHRISDRFRMIHSHLRAITSSSLVHLERAAIIFWYRCFGCEISCEFLNAACVSPRLSRLCDELA